MSVFLQLICCQQKHGAQRPLLSSFTNGIVVFCLQTREMQLNTDEAVQTVFYWILPMFVFVEVTFPTECNAKYF